MRSKSGCGVIENDGDAFDSREKSLILPAVLKDRAIFFRAHPALKTAVADIEQLLYAANSCHLRLSN